MLKFLSTVRKLSFPQYRFSRSIFSPLTRDNFQEHRFEVKSNLLVAKRYYSNINDMRGQKFIYAHRFKGMPKVTDLQLVEEEIPPIKNGGIWMINDYKLLMFNDVILHPLSGTGQYWPLFT